MGAFSELMLPDPAEPGVWNGLKNLASWMAKIRVETRMEVINVLTLPYAETGAAAWLGADVVYNDSGRAARDEEPISMDVFCCIVCVSDATNGWPV